MSLQLGDTAPDFTIDSTEGLLRFHDYAGSHWVVLFSHPKDFTPVCTTELGAFARRKHEFDARDTRLIGLSADSVGDHHQRWARDVDDVGGSAINYPLLADPDLEVARLCGMFHPKADPKLTVRSVFIIDPNKKVRLTLTYPPSAGRNIDEVLRVLDSLQLADGRKLTTPVDRQPGDDVIIAPSVSDQDAKKLYPAPAGRRSNPICDWYRHRKADHDIMSIHPDLAATVGHTPLLRLRHASVLTGCEILAKAEFLNPGGSIKDRTALGLLRDAEQRGLIRPGGIIVEGTAGNTGIGLALLGASLGYRTVIFMPETQSREKIDALRVTGAEVRLVPAVPYKDPNHYAHHARRHAEALNAIDTGSAWFANQFDNTANRDFHEATTGVEIWEDTGGRVDGFVCAAGTGGTLAGVGRTLKARKPGVTIALADPAGSALASYVTTGELIATGNSISEGIGSSRVTANFDGAPIDLAWSIPDDESVPLAHLLLHQEGWCVGGSSGVNLAGAIRLARALGPGHTVVTMLADAGTRYQAKLFSPAFLREKGIPVPDWLAQAFPG